MRSFEEIEVASCTVRELLTANKFPIVNTNIKGQLTIPEYQRPYVWTEKQLKKLITDLHEFAENKNEEHYYLGSFILYAENEKLNIIDGQQRLTSLMLLQLFQEDKIISNIIYNSPLSTSRIIKNILHLKKQINEQEVKMPLIDLDKINVTIVVTKREDLAYTFFETQNTGGKRLSGADIIKSHHLRAVKSNALMALQATRWEQRKMQYVEYTINILTKIRFWNVLKWKNFPFYRNDLQIKNTIVNEFTEKSRKENLDITYRSIEVIKTAHEEHTRISSSYKAIRQPLFDGNNYLDFLMDYVELYEILFKQSHHYAIEERFYAFRDVLVTGENGTIFLKELFEIALITYTSKFGFQNIYEFSLWCFRYVYSTRVITQRTVREESVFKFVREQHLIDQILNSFDEHQVLNFLKSYTYNFDGLNCEKTKVKGKYILMLADYFEPYFKTLENITEKFDANLKQAINNKLYNV